MTERRDPPRHIVAMGGGQWPGDPIYHYLVDLTGAAKPKVLYVPTATGDADRGVAAFYRSFPSTSFEPSDLALFERTVKDIRSFVLEQDLVLVQGGNTANMLAVWRIHGVDAVLREAWTSGVVMAGGSAGANCWFEASTTDSFLMGHADALPDGLGLAAGSFCPHYDSEPARRPSYLRLVGERSLPAGLACDDLAAVHVVDADVAEIVASAPGSRAYRVSPADDAVATEEPLDVRTIGGAA
jgi:dipeptidase E